jgi:hypothetical protein
VVAAPGDARHGHHAIHVIDAAPAYGAGQHVAPRQLRHQRQHVVGHARISRVRHDLCQHAVDVEQQRRGAGVVAQVAEQVSHAIPR